MTKPTILDGGFSRELIRLGAPFKQPEWSALALIEAPDYVKQVHQAFAAAGAEILTTNSYALVPFHIGEDRFQSQGEELAALSGRLAREVADEYATHGEKILVAGCLPPIFGSYEPEKFDAGRVQDYLAVLVRGLAPYVDFWLGETLSLIAEAEAVKTAIYSSQKPFWFSFTIDDNDARRPPTLRSGESIEAATAFAINAGAEGLLFNCSSPEFMTPAIRAAHRTLMDNASIRRPKLGVYANAFEPKPKEQAANENISTTRPDLTPEAYLAFVKQWTAHGAEIVGGCCGIGCDHIKLMAQEYGLQSKST